VPNITTLHPDRPTTKLRRVSWLTELLDLKSDKQTYDAIAKGHIPAGCVIRIGRSIRIRPDAVYVWLDTQGQEAHDIPAATATTKNGKTKVS
jgi:hypothetical protein